jgi:restriction endonuclease S subunit
MPMIQLGDISSDGRVDFRRLTRIHGDDMLDRHLVRTGDVVFRSRGDRNTAVALDENFEEPALAVLPLMILRSHLDVVTPRYLAWAINQPIAQRHFDSTAYGTKMRMVSRTALEQLQIDVPDLETQRQILAIDALAQRERTLAILAAEKRRTLASLILGNLASLTGAGAGQERNTN